MALTHAEHQRRYREKKALERQNGEDQTEKHLKKPFFKFFDEIEDDESQFSDLETYAAHSEIRLPNISDDNDVDLAKINFGYDADDLSTLGKVGNSLAKAERVLKTFQIGVEVMSRLINRYKREEIEARIAELEASDLNDPAIRKAALADIVRLNKILDRLKKEVRLSIPVTEVKG